MGFSRLLFRKWDTQRASISARRSGSLWVNVSRLDGPWDGMSYVTIWRMYMCSLADTYIQWSSRLPHTAAFWMQMFNEQYKARHPTSSYILRIMRRYSATSQQTMSLPVVLFTLCLLWRCSHCSMLVGLCLRARRLSNAFAYSRILIPSSWKPAHMNCTISITLIIPMSK